MSQENQLFQTVKCLQVSTFLANQLKSVIHKGKCYIRASVHFLDKIKNINTFWENAIPLSDDFVGLCPNIPHQVGFSALRRDPDSSLVKDNYRKRNYDSRVSFEE